MTKRPNPVLLEAADQTKAALFSTESHIDLAIAGVAATMLRLGSDRERAGLTIFHTQKVLEDAAALATKMIDARADLGRFHTRMEAAARVVGIKHRDIGPILKPNGLNDDPVADDMDEVEDDTPQETAQRQSAA